MKNKLDAVEIKLNTATITIAPEFMEPFQTAMDSVWAQVADQDEDEEGRLSCEISHDLLEPCDRAFLASIFLILKPLWKRRSSCLPFWSAPSKIAVIGMHGQSFQSPTRVGIAKSRMQNLDST